MLGRGTIWSRWQSKVEAVDETKLDLRRKEKKATRNKAHIMA